MDVTKYLYGCKHATNDEQFLAIFPWWDFSDISRILIKCLTFPWQLSKLLTFPGFPDKWSPCNLLLRNLRSYTGMFFFLWQVFDTSERLLTYTISINSTVNQLTSTVCSTSVINCSCWCCCTCWPWSTVSADNIGPCITGTELVVLAGFGYSHHHYYNIQNLRHSVTCIIIPWA